MKNLKSAFVLFAFFGVIATSTAQTLHKAPKQYSFELGYRYLTSNTFDLKNQGFSVLFDYAWQLSGYTGKPAAYLSVPLGYTVLFGGDGLNKGRILSYGWTVRHNLKNIGKGNPYFGYGLLLNQLSPQGSEGRIFGHQTRFDLGYTFINTHKIKPFIKLEYSITRYPSLDKPKSDKIGAVELKTGIHL
jgi:hypothetical protein